MRLTRLRCRSCTSHEADISAPATMLAPRRGSSGNQRCETKWPRPESAQSEMARRGHFAFSGSAGVANPCCLGPRRKAKRSGLFFRCHWESAALSPPAYIYRREGPVQSVGCASILTCPMRKADCFARASPDHVEKLTANPASVNPCRCIGENIRRSRFSLTRRSHAPASRLGLAA